MLHVRKLFVSSELESCSAFAAEQHVFFFTRGLRDKNDQSGDVMKFSKILNLSPATVFEKFG